MQGPDGQFILQNAPAPATPTILSQTSIAPSSFLNSNPNVSVQQPSSLTVAGVSTTNTTYTLQPSISQPNLSALPTPTLTSVIDGHQLLPQTGQHQQLLAELSLPTSNIQQLPTSQVGLTSFIGSNAGSNLGTSATVTSVLNSTTTSATISTVPGTLSTPTTSTGGSPTKSKRSNVDPNRLPLYLDTRLPPGWHRKVSQRKSGASAGRYEVFIIGPTGKRFRSRNEMRAFFDKTNNDSNIDPDDFDFSIFGSNNITSGRAPPKTQPGSIAATPPASSISTPRNKSSNPTRKVQSSSVVAYKRPKNLRDLLVKSKFQSGRRSDRILNGFSRCDRKFSGWCETCKLIPDPERGIKDHTCNKTKEKFKINSSVTCTTKNVIYKISCRKCECLYIGVRFCDRFSEHRGYISPKDLSKPTGEHFNKQGHNSNEIIPTIIEQVFPFNNHLRLRREKFWINKYQAVEFGANKRS